MTDRIVRVILRGDISGFTQSMAAAKTSVVSTSAAMTAATKEGEKFRSGLNTLGNQGGKVGLVAAVGLGVAIKAATDFNSELALVQTLSHASAEEMDKLSKAALTVGKNIGYSAKAVAQGEEELIKAGVDVNDILGGALKGSLDLAAAGQTNVAAATEIAASALTQFKLKGRDVPHIADLLAAGADKALGSVEDLGEGLTQAGTTANQMGLSIEQTTGTLAAFAQAGLIGERGGTTFKQMLLQLAAPTKQARDLMDKYNISLYDNAGQIKTMPELADNLRKSLSKLTPEARNSALGIIFGARAIQGANILLSDGKKGIEDWIERVNDQGFAAQQASGKLNSLGGDVKKLGAELNAAFIGTGGGSQGPLRELTQDATKAVAAFNNLPGPIKGVTSDMLAITAIAGGGLWFGSKVIRGISETRGALQNLNLTLRDTDGNLTRTGRSLKGLAVSGGVLIGLAALDGALSAINKHDIGPTVNELGNALDNLAAGKSKTIKGLDDIGDSLDLLDSKVVNSFASVEGVIGFKQLAGLTEAITGTKSDATRLQDAAKQIDTLDQALANIVTSGSVAQASAAFDALAKSQDLSADQQNELINLLPSYRDAVAGATGGVQGETTATDTNTVAVDKNSEAQKRAMKALHDRRKAAKEVAEEFVGLGKNVDNAKVSLNSWIRQEEKQAKALRDFTKNSIEAGKKGVRDGLIKELQAAGPEGALRLKQLADGTEGQISRANKAWLDGRHAVHEYEDVVGGVAPKVRTVVTVETSEAVTKLREITGLITNLIKPRDLTVTVRLRPGAVGKGGSGDLSGLLGVPVNSGSPAKPGGADGDPRTPWAGGGYTGWGGVLDQAGVVHRREYVMSAAATDGNESQLDVLHRSLRSGKSFSTAVASANSGGSDPIDYDRLAAVVLAARPLAGHLTVMPHNYNEFLRQKRELETMSASSGIDLT